MLHKPLPFRSWLRMQPTCVNVYGWGAQPAGGETPPPSLCLTVRSCSLLTIENKGTWAIRSYRPRYAQRTPALLLSCQAQRDSCNIGAQFRFIISDQVAHLCSVVHQRKHVYGRAFTQVSGAYGWYCLQWTTGLTVPVLMLIGTMHPSCSIDAREFWDTLVHCLCLASVCALSPYLITTSTQSPLPLVRASFCAALRVEKVNTCKLTVHAAANCVAETG
jgi:hypothetical protein